MKFLPHLAIYMLIFCYPICPCNLQCILLSWNVYGCWRSQIQPYWSDHNANILVKNILWPKLCTVKKKPDWKGEIFPSNILWNMEEMNLGWLLSTVLSCVCITMNDAGHVWVVYVACAVAAVLQSSTILRLLSTFSIKTYFSTVVFYSSTFFIFYFLIVIL